MRNKFVIAITGLVLGASFAMGQEAPVEGLSQLTVDTLWVLTAAVLVFFMQAGLLAFEMGCVRPKNAAVTAMKNVGDWVIVTVVFFFVGFGVMFGTSMSGFFGTDLFFGVGVESDSVLPLGWAFFLFQLAFAGTAATIVSGAMAERTGFKAYLLYTVAMAAVIYPVLGHWVWGGGFQVSDTATQGWLYQLGFRDFAGASVVHGLGAWAALAGIWIVGPRLGRYASDGSIVQMASGKQLWSCLGVIILWMGWWGFNGGSSLTINETIPKLIFNTNLSGGMAGLVAFLHCATLQNREQIYEKTLGGILGGLVAITACCNLVSPMDAVIIGAIAGVVHNISFDLIIRKWKLDDVVGAVPVHGFCGFWGLLAVGVFGAPELLPHARGSQIAIQFLGAVVCFAWAGGVSYLVFRIIKATVGIRVSPMREIQGLSLEAQGEPEVTPEEESEADDLLASLGAYTESSDRYQQF